MAKTLVIAAEGQAFKINITIIISLSILNNFNNQIKPNIIKGIIISLIITVSHKYIFFNELKILLVAIIIPIIIIDIGVFNAPIKLNGILITLGIGILKKKMIIPTITAYKTGTFNIYFIDSLKLILFELISTPNVHNNTFKTVTKPLA